MDENTEVTLTIWRLSQLLQNFHYNGHKHGSDNLRLDQSVAICNRMIEKTIEKILKEKDGKTG